jgi:biotin carboxyl carrier protein
MSALEVGGGNGRGSDNGHSGGNGHGRSEPPDDRSGPVGLETPADHADVFTITAEEVHVPERLIAAPTAGVFRSAPPDVVTAEGEIVRVGQVVGSIEVTDGSVVVTSAHTGFLMGLLALPGERVRADQPLAWVRVVA